MERIDKWIASDIILLFRMSPAELREFEVREESRRRGTLKCLGTRAFHL